MNDNQDINQGSKALNMTLTTPLIEPQTHWRFMHHGANRMDSYALRQHLKQSLSATSLDMLQISVKQSANTIGLIARNPATAAAMTTHMGVIMGAMASIGGEQMPVDLQDGPVNVSSSPRMLYTIPTLVVAKAKGPQSDWSAWKNDPLGENQQAEMRRLIQTGIESELDTWGVKWWANEIVIIDAGNPMPIGAGHGAQGPRGMARLGVRFIAPWHIDGQLFVGHHTLLGYGLIKRGGQLREAEASSSTLATRKPLSDIFV